MAPQPGGMGMSNRASKLIGRLALAAAVATAAGGGAKAQAQAAKPPIMARAEQCLREKVDRVVADTADIAAAANFLVGFACADEVAGANRYLRNTAYVQLFGTVFKAAAAAGAGAASKPSGQGQAAPAGTGGGAAAAAMTAGALLSQLKVDPETGEINMAGAGAQASQVNAAIGQFSSIVTQFAPDTVPVSLRKLAGDLVLESRERHRAK
jgi:hypothetical protein